MNAENPYYERPAVRARINEFLGVEQRTGYPTAVFVMIADSDHADHRKMLRLKALPSYVSHDCEVLRSLWDSASLVAELDIEYVNFDFPAEPFVHPERIFELQEKVTKTLDWQFCSIGIAPLHLLSGRGHHYLWRIGRDSPAFRQLAALGRPTRSVLSHYEQVCAANGAAIDTTLAMAYHGLGRVIEYLVAETKRVSAPDSKVPVELTALEVGPSQHGREMISLDISQFGDPLDVRTVRVPYSRYLKVERQGRVLGVDVVQSATPIFEIPFYQMSLPSALCVMRDRESVAALAESASVAIPDGSNGMRGLISSYTSSSLCKFHDFYYSTEAHPAEAWSRTYDLVDLTHIPNCARLILDYPNDLLLRPSSMRRIVLVFLALGWHPRHIAGLIQSKFERENVWNDVWGGYDPATRAEFYTRIFAGLVTAGDDDLVDFNCQSAQEHGTCRVADCHQNLLEFRQSLLDRRNYERLACRPIHRLFRPDKHS